MNYYDRCYSLAKKIPRGKLVSYKQIALKLKSRGCRAVGQAMKHNKNKEVPCHRVVKSGGELGGFNRGLSKKAELLKKEGIQIKRRNRRFFVDLKKYQYTFR